jgi:Domain of unknown function (DUF4159)
MKGFTMRFHLALVTAAALSLFAFALPARGATTFGFTAARLKYGGGGDWYEGPTTLPNLMKGLRERTSVLVEGTDEAKVSLDDESLYRYPFLFMDGHGEVRFSAGELEALRRYLDGGGFLWANDDYGMDTSFRREMQRLYPDTPLIELPFSHPIYHCFYDLPHGVPKVHEHDNKPAQGFGIFRNGRLVVYYDYESDIGDGLESPEVHKDTPAAREQAMRMAINIVIYAMTN